MSAIVTTVSPFSTSVTRKAILAVTGLILYGFVFVHMMGNLQLYQGKEKINAYAELLQSHPPVLWGARLVLLTAVGTHIFLSLLFWWKNRAARPVKYTGQQFLAGSLASRTMIWTGPILGAFIVFHLLHLTVGAFPPGHVEGDVYGNVVKGFQIVPVSAFYIIAMVLLGFHLTHGAFSLFQSLGLRFTKYEKPLKMLLYLVTYTVVALNISFPLAVLAGLVK